MAGHSKWAQIKRAKGAADAKKGAVFTKLSKNISLAAKNGKDPDMNPALRTAIDTAKEANMPKANIEKAILRGAGELPGQQIEEISYEGYGPGGVAILIRCATDNTNRTSSFIKSTLSKAGGNLGGPGTVSYLFTKRGVIRTESTSDDIQLTAMDAGADDIIEEEGGLTIYTAPEQLPNVKNQLGALVQYAEIELVAETKADVDSATQSQVEKLLEILEDNEDVIDLTHNGNF